jgi:L-Ala-D/L-Glu epimerase / N-acetyl-D-glutamate racemase
MKLNVYALSIPFKFNFSHASANRNRSSSVFVEIKRGGCVGFGEGCPREYVTGETIDGAIEWIKDIRSSLKEIATIEALKGWVLSNDSMINQNPSAWCAVETAFIDLIGKESGKTVEGLLQIDRNRAAQKITAVISDGNIKFIEKLLKKCVAFGFTDFKIKLSGNLEGDFKKVALLKKNIGEDCSVRVDFNNAFSSKNIHTFIQYLEKLDYNFVAIEEPFEPYAISAMLEVIEIVNIPIILDESFTKFQDIGWITTSSNLIPNIRISKMGGLLRSLSLLEELNKRTGRIILGSLVGETSILSRLWLVMAGYYGQQLFAGESAYSTHILKRDITELPIIIKPPGVIHTTLKIMNSPGLGIDISPMARKYLTKY